MLDVGDTEVAEDEKKLWESLSNIRKWFYILYFRSLQRISPFSLYLFGLHV